MTERCGYGIWRAGKKLPLSPRDSEVVSVAIAPDGKTIIAGDTSGQVHYLRLEEADKTKPPTGHTKVQILLRQGASKWIPNFHYEFLIILKSWITAPVDRS
jgi:hypothetical protein